MLTSRLAVLAVVAISLGACRETPLLAPVPGAAAAMPQGLVRADILEDSVEANGAVRYVVRIRSRDVLLSAFQGSVMFTPGAFEVVSVIAPYRDGETYLFNPEEVADGRIRFAAMSPTAFADAFADEGVVALRLTLRPLRPVSEADLSATLDVAGHEAGAAIDAIHLRPSGVIRRSALRGDR